MPDHEQQLIDATSRYLALLDKGAPISVGDFVATADPALRAELAEYLEFALAVGSPAAPLQPTPAERAIADRAADRARARLAARIHERPPRTLTAARVARRLSSAALARQIDLPVDLLVRIERGGVRSATLPHVLIARLAAALQHAEADLRAMLAAPPPAAPGLRLSAQDPAGAGTEAIVDFAEALRASSATPAQRAAWSTAEP